MPTPTKTIADAITDLSADGIARAIGMLATTDTLSAGTRLPTVRELAEALNVSPTTVGDAWQILRRHRVIDTEGRRGSFVRDTSSGPTIRYWRVPTTGDAIKIDLCSGVPDARLLPNPLTVIRELDATPVVTSYLERPVLAELEEILRSRWPFGPQRMTILNGAMDALDRLIQATITVGDKVGISDPGFPPLFDMLDLAGAESLPLPLDEEGLEPEAVGQAVDQGMTVLIIQPRAHNPTGVSMTTERRDELAATLADRAVLVIEDDHSGQISGADLFSLGSAIPEQVVHVRSFSKSHGPDFRIAAIGGASDPITMVERRRMLGPSWTSRLLQEVLASMLASDAIEASITVAADTYAKRRSDVVERLASHGVTVGGRHGLNIWMPVHNEATAVPMLAAHGIGVARGRPFRLAPDDRHFIRVTTGALDTEIEDITTRLAEASHGILDDTPDQNGGRR
ncbi:MAG: aminotransferase class I/II-fold pyridoxal phosphate-dependent enzyme [Acidimicrobiia bacterium]|nr:MAG: aminotransferase class I/II-fold pyridoxal phosphate-dependent enzyme [Acidimicrobiia bacterium]